MRIFILHDFLAKSHYLMNNYHVWVSCPHFPYVLEQHVALIHWNAYIANCISGKKKKTLQGKSFELFMQMFYLVGIFG